MFFRDKTHLIGVKLTGPELLALDSLVALRFESRSAAIRAALDAYFAASKLKVAAAADIQLARVMHKPRRRKSLRDDS